ncbi:MAG: isocitrate lyase/phosphoenolpyruvate mutase family protein [Actinomycetota bacterium]|nr:isocitrate lyase/phosphoenolpyruvate mutase family protein [Actinomycetota bacterium]
MTDELAPHCELLRSLHVPGDPLVLPNAWDAASARAVVAAGFPVVATTSAGVAAVLGYEDHEGAPGDEMLAAAARMGRAVDVPLTVDAEAGYGMEPAELVAALKGAGAAGCNLEETDHATGKLRDPAPHADWLRSVREAAAAQNYSLVINARIDVFLSGEEQGELLPDALERAQAYLEAGADCLYPIALWETQTVATFVREARGPVNILASPRAPSPAELAELGVARLSYGHLLHKQVMEQFESTLASISADGR